MPEMTQTIGLTEAAVAKVAELLRREEPGLALQVAVQPGGCSGLRYQLFFTDRYTKALAWMLAERNGEEAAGGDDPQVASQREALAADQMEVIWYDTFAVVVDPLSGEKLKGSEVDHLDTLQKSGFVIENPNANGSCACGDSYR